MTDAEFRSHVEALLWVMRKETGGWMSRRDLLRALESEDADLAIKGLLFKGAWIDTMSDQRSSSSSGMAG